MMATGVDKRSTRNDDCTFFLAGKCTKGQKCRFRHCQEATTSFIICTDWLSKKCFNQNCPNRHGTYKGNPQQQSNPNENPLKQAASTRTSTPERENNCASLPKTMPGKQPHIDNRKIILSGLSPEVDANHKSISDFFDFLNVKITFIEYQIDKKAALVGFKEQQDISQLIWKLKMLPDHGIFELKSLQFCKKSILSNIPLGTTRQELISSFQNEYPGEKDPFRSFEFETGQEYALVELKNVQICKKLSFIGLHLKGQLIQCHPYNGGFRTVEVDNFLRSRSIGTAAPVTVTPTLVESIIFVEKEKKDFLAKFGKEKFELVQSNLKKHSVTIRLMDETDKIIIEGDDQGSTRANEEITKIISDIIIRKVSLQHPGVVSLFAKEIARSFRSGIENDFSVMIVDDERRDSDYSNIGCDAKALDSMQATATASQGHQAGPKGVSVEVVTGNIADQQTDVIVNSVARNFNLDANASSRALSNAAGPLLQFECNNFGTKNIKQDIFVTDGFLLKCKEIFHVHLRHDVQAIQTVVKNVLTEASSRGHKSVAFPALGTGNLGFDRDTVAKMFRESIDGFFKISGSSLEKVNIVVFDQETTQAFKHIYDSFNPTISTQSRLDSELKTQSVWKYIFGFFRATDPGPSTSKQDASQPSPSINLKIYGFDAALVDNAIERIKTFASECSNVMTIQLPSALNLHASEILKVKEFAGRVNVSAEEDAHGEITLKGGSKEISDVVKFCHEIEVKRIENESLEPLPSHWSSMTSNNPSSLPYLLVALQPYSAEYSQVNVKFRATIGEGRTLVSIQRIQNPQLYRAFMVKKRSMDKNSTKGSNEQQLFHGTAKDTCEDINHHGFNRSFAGKNGTAYGNGTYFAKNSSYSVKYAKLFNSLGAAKCMYLARVLVGEYVQGASGLRVPPKKQHGSTTTEMYDSTVDSVANPSIFVVYHDNQSYPEYLITFN